MEIILIDLAEQVLHVLSTWYMYR